MVLSLSRTVPERFQFQQLAFLTWPFCYQTLKATFKDAQLIWTLSAFPKNMAFIQVLKCLLRINLPRLNSSLWWERYLWIGENGFRKKMLLCWMSKQFHNLSNRKFRLSERKLVFYHFRVLGLIEIISSTTIRVTTTQRKGLMIYHQTRPTLHLHNQYHNQPFQCSHQFHFKEL